ncbi:MAG: GreA/GreB family elongation factor [Clostridia bacterium]
MNKMQVTARQKEALAAKVAELEVQRTQAELERTRAASGDGDKSENTSLDIAEKTFMSVEQQLHRAREDYERAEVMESINTDTVGLLTRVELTNKFTSATRSVTIVDDGQGGPPDRVSCRSRMGTALLGCAVGDEVSYQDNQFRVQSYIVKQISADT